MKLSELIQRAQKLLETEGDLDVLTEDHYDVSRLSLEEAEDLPDDWDLPDGTKFIMVCDTR